MVSIPFQNNGPNKNLKKDFNNENAGLVPPQNVQAEEAVLGGILLDPDAIGRIADLIKPEAFYINAHQEIYKTALSTIGRFTIKKQVGEDGILFGTVTNGDVAEAIEAATKKEIDRRNITVPDIHNLGSFTAKIKLHPEVNAEVNIEVTS